MPIGEDVAEQVTDQPVRQRPAAGSPAAAMAVNADAPARLAEAAARSGAAMVQFSTDYVFDGTLGRPYREDDPPRPLGATWVHGR